MEADQRMSRRKRKNLQKLLERQKQKQRRVEILEALQQHRLRPEEKANLSKTEEESCRSRKDRIKFNLKRAEVFDGEILDPEVRNNLERREERKKKRDEARLRQFEEEEEICLPKIEKKPVLVEVVRKVEPVLEEKKPETRLRNSLSNLGGAIGCGFVSVSRTKKVEICRSQLPAVQKELEVVEAACENDIFIVCGDTGCGKSTQIPQFLFEVGFTRHEKRFLIGVTQPRRVAATNVAKRLREELNDENLVGYQVRYNSSNLHEKNEIKVMTDGILLREIQSDHLLSQYSVIVVDEAHERSINCDVLLGLLSRVAKSRRRIFDEKNELVPLKICIMSATLRLCDFTQNFRLFRNEVKLVSIDSRTHPVVVHHARQTAKDYVKAAKRKVLEIHRNRPPGTILVFLTGKKEVLDLCRELENSSEFGDLEEFTNSEDSEEGLVENENSDENEDDKEEDEKKILELDKGFVREVEMEELEPHFKGGLKKLRVLPLYAQLPEDLQQRCFSEDFAEDERIVVVATNVAETSITLPNVRYVVDSGREKRRVFRNSGEVSSFEISWISKSSGDQRMGRSGRVGPGHCFRLYSSACYQDVFTQFPPIAVRETPLDQTLLFLCSLEIRDLLRFPWPTAPSLQSLELTTKRLGDLGAIETKYVDGRDLSKITRLGDYLSLFPLSPRLANVVCQSLLLYEKTGKSVISQACAVAAGLAVGNLLMDEIRIKADDDFQVLLSAVGVFWHASRESKTIIASQWNLNYKNVNEASKLTLQLFRICEKILKTKLKFELRPLQRDEKPLLKRALASAFFDQIAFLDTKRGYRIQQTEEISFIHASSVYSHEHPSCLVYSECLGNSATETSESRLFLRTCMTLTSEEVCLAAGKLCDLGEFSRTPPPRYCPRRDSCYGFCTPVYLPLSRPLDSCEVEIPHENIVRYRVFAEALFEGRVFSQLKDLKGELVIGPEKLKKNLTRPAVLSFLNNLREEKVGSRVQFLMAKKKNPQFLLPVYKEFLPSSSHERAEGIWKTL